jgi:Zn-dependent protease with chaperone function
VVAGAAIPADAVPGAPRVNVLAFPPVTTGRVLILVAAMLAAGLFVGSAVFTVAAGASLSTAAAECSRLPPGQPGGPDLFSLCVAPAERPRALFAAGAAALVVLGALAVLFLAPVVVERRLRLRLPGPSLAPAVQRMQALAQEAGLRHPPTLVVGPTALRDAFCYGRPGRYRIALPTGLAIRPASMGFDAVVRHELAHVAHRDVVLSWMARSVWYALTPLLVLPVILSLARGDFSIVPDYLWRAAVLAAVVLLAQRAVLRSREYDADLRADQAAGAGEAMAAVLSSIRRPPVTRLRRALAHHPDAADRLDVLRNPERATAVTVVDGITVAFLAALTLPILNSVLNSAFLGGQHVDLVHVVSAVLVGPVLGATIGLGLWRQSLVSRVTGTQARVAPVALGVFVGGVLGQAMSFAGTALPGIGGFDRPLVIFVVGLGVAGATVVAAGLGEVWADVSGRFNRSSGNWLPATVLSAALFSVVLWASDVLQTALELGGWPLARGVVWASLASLPVLVLALVLAAVVAWALWATRAGGWAPAWLVRPGIDDLRWSPPAVSPSAVSPSAVSPPAVRLGRTLAVGVASGLAGAAVLIGFRLLSGLPAVQAEQEQRYYTYLWLAAVVGAVAALLVALMHGDRGRGAALLASPLAAVTVSVGFFALNTALGGPLTRDVLVGVLQPAIAMAFLLYVAAAWLTLLALPLARATPPAVLAVTTAAVVAAGAALGVIGGRDALVPPFDQLTAIQPAQPLIIEQAVLDYKIRTGPALFARRVQLNTKAMNIDADPSLTLADRAARYRDEILVPLRDILDDAELYVPPDDRVANVHQRCVTALRLAVTANENLARAVELNNPILLAQGQAALHRESEEWETWVNEVTQL